MRRGVIPIIVAVVACKAPPSPAPVPDAAPAPADAEVVVAPVDAAPIAEEVDAASTVASPRVEVPDGGVRVLTAWSSVTPPTAPSPAAANVVIGTFVMTPSRPGGVAAARRVVASLRPKLIACQTRALSSNPDDAGRVMLKCQVSREGAVTNVDVLSADVSAGLAGCTSQVLRAARLPESDSDSVVVVPITFQRPQR